MTTLLVVPLAVGVPLMVIVAPLSDTDSPAGNPVAVTTEPDGGATTVIGIVAAKPGCCTVQLVDEAAPRTGLASTSRMTLLSVSPMNKLPLPSRATPLG